MRIARVAVLLLALVISGWFALSVREEREVARATNLITASQTLTARQLQEVQSWLDSATTLNPDRTVDILRARALIKAGQARHAERLMQSLTRDEPLNFEAWVWLGGSALGDPPLARQAIAHIDALDPRDRRR